MKKLRRISIVCCIMAVVMLISGCTERIRQDDIVLSGVDNTISLGVYRAFQVDNTGNAYSYATSETGLFEQNIDGKPAETWINEETKQNIRYYVALEQALRELGALEMTAEEKAALEKTVDAAWNDEGASYYYGENGVTRKSFETYMYYRSLEDKLFNAMYSSVSDDALYNYACDNVYMAKFMWVLKKSAGADDAQSINDALRAAFEGYKRQYDAGAMSFEDILAKEAGLKASDSNRPAVSSNDVWVNYWEQVNLPDEIHAQLKAAKPGDTVLALDAPSNMIYFFATYTEDEISAYLSDGEHRQSVLEWMQVNSFEDFVEQKMSELTLTYNEDMLSLYTPKDIDLGYDEEAE